MANIFFCENFILKVQKLKKTIPHKFLNGKKFDNSCPLPMNFPQIRRNILITQNFRKI